MMTTSTTVMPAELKPFLNHVYELKKGVRRMALYTTNRKFEPFIINRLDNQKIKYYIQSLGSERINIFFGHAECVNMICKVVDKPLNKLTPEEDFILGALLGYDLSIQCQRYCKRKGKIAS